MGRSFSPAWMLVVPVVAVIPLAFSSMDARALDSPPGGSVSGHSSPGMRDAYRMSREDTHELMIPPEPAHETELAAPRMSASDDQNDNDDVEITPVETEPDVEESPSPKNSPEPVETQPADAGDTGIL